ncbi:MAG: HEAT repeat domain-containing protein [Planctomycetota bacterium]
MNETIKTILGLLDTGKPEIQVAAAQVLGELRITDSTAVKALAGGLRRSPVLARFCLDALAKTQTEEAVALIARMAVEMDPLGDHAMHLAIEAGASAHPILAAAYQEASIEQRLRILGILARHIGKDAIAVFVHALLTPETTEAAARSLIAARTQFTPANQKLLRDSLQKYTAGALPDSCLSQVVLVLAAVDPEGSRQYLAGFLGAETGSAVRSAAYRSLQGSRLSATQVRTMLDLLEDPAQKGVHDAVRDVLAGLPEVPAPLIPSLKRLLLARVPEQRLFALRMLRTAGGADMAKTALKLLDHEDERFRAAAIEALAHNRQAVEPLLRLLLTSKDANLAQVASQALVRLRGHLSPKFVRALADKALKLLAANARTADLLLDVVLAAGGSKLAAFLTERCVRLRRVSRHADAMHVLARTIAVAPDDTEVRYQLALTKLLHDAAQPASETVAPGNSTMGFLAALVRSGFPVFDRLRKETSVTADLMLRIATHFAPAVGPERKLATELLRHLATRTKGRAGDEAKIALRAVGG